MLEVAKKQIFISDLREKDQFRSTFLVKQKSLQIARNAKPYLALLLGDRTGEIDTRIWEGAEELSDRFSEGDFVAVSGKTHRFHDRLQLVVQHLAPVPSEELNLEDYFPQAEADLPALYAGLIEIFEGIKNPWIKELGLRLLKDPEIARRFPICPAAKTVHHAYRGGLLVHVRQLIRLVDAVAPHYPVLDRDLLVFGATFHDFGKVFELSYDREFGYTDEGKLVGHITIGATLIDREVRNIESFPKELEWQLKHLVLSHHGRLEYGSPKRPHTLEALMLHALDDLDSKMESIETFMRSERNTSRWTGHHRPYDQYYYKPDRYVEKPTERD